jgi:hypothetical protein
MRVNLWWQYATMPRGTDFVAHAHRRDDNAAFTLICLNKRRGRSGLR